MNPSPGVILGSYEVLGPLGAGGMGEVWRAKDMRLGREVALKFLPADFAADPERSARLEREAKLLASLNHPNIAVLYGLERFEGQHALVMELVEGDSLDDQIRRGPMPVEEAIPIARQIAEALEAAHEKGIVHRDLKPANVKVRPDGTVKVLDFGLAKAWGEPETDFDLALSPTITGHHTRAGVILGTAAYMSPEQARGKSVDKRADIWAFGCVLFEMLAGRKLFEGETVTDILAAVLTKEPDWNALPPSVSRGIRRVLARCVQRDPRRRFRDMGDVRIELDEFDDVSATSPAEPRPPRLRRWLAWVLPAALCLAGLTLGAVLFRQRAAEPVVRASLLPSAGSEFFLVTRQPGPVSISPDGTRIVYAARDDEHGVRLWVRSLDSFDAVPLPGTQNGSYPFWSPNGRSIAFFADGKLKRMDLPAGSVMTLADAPFGKSGTWNDHGVILFAQTYDAGLFRIPAEGGDLVPVTRLDPARRENSHRFPQFLPDGEHFIFLTRVSGESGRMANQLMVGSLSGEEPKPLIDTATNVAYASGFLLYTREKLLLARPFDPARMKFEGEEFTVADDIGIIPGAALAVFSVSRNGVLVYGHSSSDNPAHLAWFDRSGQTVGTLGPSATYEQLAFAPDGRHLAVTVQDPTSGQDDLWALDTERGIPVRLTSGTSGSRGPTWLMDSTNVVFTTRGAGHLDLYQMSVEGHGDARLLVNSDADKEPLSASPDGHVLAFRTARKNTGEDVWMLPLDGKSAPYPFLQSRFDEEEARFSPDGRWLAFQSDETGRNEIYISAFPQPRERWRVSSDGGVYPRWSRDGRELYYRSGDFTDVMAVQVTGEGSSIALGKPARLFRVPPSMKGEYDTWGGRFLFIVDDVIHDRTPLSLVVNWTRLATSQGAR